MWSKSKVHSPVFLLCIRIGSSRVAFSGPSQCNWTINLTKQPMNLCVCTLMMNNPWMDDFGQHVSGKKKKCVFKSSEATPPNEKIADLPVNSRFWSGMYNRFEKGLHPRQSVTDYLMAVKEETQQLEEELEVLGEVINTWSQCPRLHWW